MSDTPVLYILRKYGESKGAEWSNDALEANTWFQTELLLDVMSIVAFIVITPLFPTTQIFKQYDTLIAFLS